MKLCAATGTGREDAKPLKLPLLVLGLPKALRPQNSQEVVQFSLQGHANLT